MGENTVVGFILGAIVSLVSSLATGIVSHILTVRREERNRRREYLERIGAVKLRRGEFINPTDYYEIVKIINSLPDDVLSVWMGALKHEYDSPSAKQAKKDEPEKSGTDDAKAKDAESKTSDDTTAGQ
jgi:hypothetical protein